MNSNIKTALIIGGIVIAAIVIVPVVLGTIYGGQYGGWGMMGPGMMGSYGWGWFGPIFVIIFWGLIIWGVVALLRGLSQQKGADATNSKSALEILKERYARGEINKEEYEEKKRDLEK